MPSREEMLKALSAKAGQWWRHTRQAAVFLTRLPLPAGGAAAGKLADSAAAFPLVGAVIGGVSAAALILASWLGLHPLACALIGLAAASGLTGALHEDGLADVADGFGGGKSRAGKLKIMRDSRIGAYGVLALVFSVGVRASVLSGMNDPASAAAALIAAGALSRANMVAVMARLEPARKDGLSATAGRPGNSAQFAALMIGAVLAAGLLGFISALAALLAGAGAAAALAWLARRQVGGHTGDVLGAVQQAGEIAVLIAAAATE